jgi:hypothetical protein
MINRLGSLRCLWFSDRAFLDLLPRYAYKCTQFVSSLSGNILVICINKHVTDVQYIDHSFRFRGVQFRLPTVTSLLSKT